MSTSRTAVNDHQHITPLLSFVDQPLTPPRTDEKPFTQAHRVIALFEAIRAGRHTNQGPWREFLLAPGEYDELVRLLGQNEELLGYVKDKIRYDYDAIYHRLVVRMPTAVHELFVARVEDAIFSQLKSIRKGSDGAAAFARKIDPTRSTEIYLIQVVVGLDIEYGKRESRKATLSVWRTYVNGNEIRVAPEVADEAFRNQQGDPTDHKGLRLQLKDFAYEELALRELGDTDLELVISTQQLCEYLHTSETRVARLESLGRPLIAPGLKKRKRSETPPDQITSGDEAQFAEQEQRAAKRVAQEDSDYEVSSFKSTSE
ncbi:hypothetical protein BCR34DRAFT_575120 [Clohesyomyces aquaticus]|uniref:Uncharacterized protein n=1 Tax=Clohesyomyces aquaticus TaxID=1231657 RepID=A0A1Y1YTA2_9PLEO|nr:hypothetical protein BCR34DRAFT_575120 [Clohesyomyces aquaticus]